MNGDPNMPVDLTEAGREQARELGRALADEPIDLCVTTEFLRTRAPPSSPSKGRDVPIASSPT